MKLSEKTIMISAFSVILLFIIIGILKNNPPPRIQDHKIPTDAVSSIPEKVTKTEKIVKPVVQTETLYILSRANVRNGPGKNYEVIDRLELSFTVEVYKDDNTKWKALTDNKGYIYHTLLGTEKQHKEVQLIKWNKDIKTMKNLGLFIKILKPDEYHHKIYVNYNLWTYQVTQKQKQNIMMNYAYGISLLIDNKFLKGSAGCSIYASHNGQRLLSYRLGSNSFF